MTKIKNPFRGVKVEYARSHSLTKILIIFLIVVCMAAMIALGCTVGRLRQEIQELRSEAAQLEAENTELSQLVEGQDSVEGMENAAENELGLVDPDTIVIDPNP